MLTGNKDLLQQKYTTIYGDGNHEELIGAIRRRNKKLYIIILVSGLALMLLCGIMGKLEGEKGLIFQGHSLVGVERMNRNLVLKAETVAEGEEQGISATVSIKPITDNAEDKSTELTVAEVEKNRDAQEIEDLMRGLSKSSAEAIDLPQTLESGTKVMWSVEKSGRSLPILALMMGALFFVYCKRNNAAFAEERAARESIVHELPEFMNKILLLLSAGMIITAGFEKIMGEYETHRNVVADGKRNYFYEELRKIKIRMRETNCSFSEELKSYAKRSGVREFMRFAAIIGDNVGKGAELAEKLGTESELLWFSRKKEAEKRGRLADTKMTLPLMLLLLVLIMITIAPAIMEM